MKAKSDSALVAELLAALKIAHQWMPVPGQAYTPEAEQETQTVAAAIRKAEGR